MYVLTDLLQYVFFLYQTIRVVGLLGALDPYKRKLNQTKGSGSSGQGLPVSEAIHKGADSQDGNNQGVCVVCVFSVCMFSVCMFSVCVCVCLCA